MADDVRESLTTLLEGRGWGSPEVPNGGFPVAQWRNGTAGVNCTSNLVIVDGVPGRLPFAINTADPRLLTELAAFLDEVGL